MKTRNRLLGVDLFRGIAAYAVVLLHSGDSTWGDIDQSVFYLRNLFGFPVPFFLATSFYFMANTLAKANWDTGIHFKILRSKAFRLVLPYLNWTLIYLVIRNVYLSIVNSNANEQDMLQDVLSVIFFGGASYHLYFIPLLFTGIITFLFLNLWNNWRSISLVYVYLVISLLFYELISFSGNGFELGSNMAFQNIDLNLINYLNSTWWGRWLLVEISWSWRCLPYIFTTIILQQTQIIDYQSGNNKLYKYNNLTIIILLTIFTIATGFEKYFLSTTSSNLLIAFSLLFIALIISRQRISLWLVKTIANLGKCSLGIYLIHAAIVPIIKLKLTEINPSAVDSVSLGSVILISVTSFSLSWLVVSLLLRQRSLARYLFAVR